LAPANDAGLAPPVARYTLDEAVVTRIDREPAGACNGEERLLVRARKVTVDWLPAAGNATSFTLG
ncbi:MAG: hypothetical protein ACRD0M_10335, partial [Acidimicrobiales bacterium]